MSKPTVAIVGRPNVGKSTLFNRIIGGRRAIVSERPGTTRDRHFGDADWSGRRFWVVDTGGLVPESDDSMDRAIREQVDFALAEADVVLLPGESLNDEELFIDSMSFETFQAGIPVLARPSKDFVDALLEPVAA